MRKSRNLVGKLDFAITKFVCDLFREKLHTSWLAAVWCAGFLVGVGLSASDFSRNFVGWYWFVISILFLILSLISRLKIVLVAVLISGILLGIGRGTLSQNSIANYREYIGHTVTVEAKVGDDPGVGSNGDTSLKLIDIKLQLAGSNKFISLDSGQIFASVNSGNQDIERSDQVQITGKLSSGFGDFAAALDYGQLQKITTFSGADPALELRDSFGLKLRSVVPSPAADLGMGILAGQKTALPSAISAAFIAASLTHIVVASGYNLTILIRFARRLFAKISRFVALAMSGLLVFAFANVTGFSPSMTRASLVAGLSLLAWYYGRKFHPVVILLLAASITVAIDPSYLWGDAGWWMSFTSFAGVLIFAPLVKSFFWGDKIEFREKRLSKFSRNAKKPDSIEKKHVLRQIFIETLSAQLMSAPIIALMMGQFSPYGLIANLLVLPVLPLAMLMTFCAGIGAFILPTFFAKLVALPATWLLNYAINIAKWIANLPGASQSVSFGIWPTIGLFFAILLSIVWMKLRTRHSFYGDNLVE